MELSDWADVATIAATIIAVLGVGWLVFVQVRRQRRDSEYQKLLDTTLKKFTDDFAAFRGAAASIPERAPSNLQLEDVQFASIALHLNQISNQLLTLIVISAIDLARKSETDTELGSLLAEWKLRSPIVRKEEERLGEEG